MCRYIRIADRILEAMLPAPHRFMDILRSVGSKEEFDVLFPPRGAAAGAVLVDGTHVRFDRAGGGGRDVRDAMYSRKKKAYPDNTVLMTMPDGMVIAIGRTPQGSAHDIAITRELIGDLGAFAQDVLGTDPPKDARRVALRVLADSRLRGLDRDLPGAEVVTPVKRPLSGELTKRQREHNKRLSGERIRVKNAIAAVKHYRASRPCMRRRLRALTPSSTSRAGWPTRGSRSGTARTATGSPFWAEGRGASRPPAAACR